jgi:hypothetical protein
MGLENENIDRREMLLLVVAATKELDNIRELLGKCNHQGISTTSVIALPMEVEPTIEAFAPFFEESSGQGSGGGGAVIIMLKARERKVGQLQYKSYQNKGLDKQRKDDYANNHGLWSVKK